MTTHYMVISGIIVLVGSFAGLSNFLEYYFKNLIKSNYEIFKFVISGVGAAILVPLLLNMLSSNLIKETESFDVLNYFVFAGFCFVAGFFSDRFINSVGDKILKDIERTNDKVDEVISSTKENEEKIDFIVSADSEVDEVASDAKIDLGEFKIQSTFEDDDVKTQIEKIIKSFGERYKFRTAKGIAKELNYNETVTSAILEGLKTEGLSRKLTTRDGKVLWALTKMSNVMISNSQDSESK